MNKKNILSRLPNMAFLCGANKTDSMRSQFINYIQSEHRHIFISGKATKNVCSNERVILAEQVEELWDKCLNEKDAGYDNLLEFEMDIAELASVIPIFLEGPGAMIETGAFFCKSNLRKKLLIILKKDYFHKDSFIQRAIIKDPSLDGRIIYYDSQDETRNKKILEEIFSFRDNLNNKIDIQENSSTALYFFLLQVLFEWKTKEQIIEELNKNDKLKKYKSKLENHLKILTALGLIIKEPDFTQTKFLSLTRGDLSITILPHSLSVRNKFHETEIFNQIISKLGDDKLILLKYMKKFADEDYFSYSYPYRKHPSLTYETPTRELDTIQKTLKTRILNNRDIFPIHESATAYVENTNIRKNVEKHSENQFILKMDFKCFFNSIKRSDFVKYLKNKKFENKKFDAYIEFICDIAFKSNSAMKKDFSLPIGASTSPIISNTLLYSFDEKISKYSDSLGITYTRYADDLTFSHDRPNKLCTIEGKVKEIIREIPYPVHLQINDRKTVHMSKKGQKKITGLYLTPAGKISIGRNKKNYIKKLLRDYEKEKYTEKAQHIQGYLCFIKNVEREFWDRLHNKYIKKNYSEKDFSKPDKFYDLFYNNGWFR